MNFISYTTKNFFKSGSLRKTGLRATESGENSETVPESSQGEKENVITSTLIVHQTELRNSSPETGSNKVEEKVKCFIKTQQLSVTMQN